MPLEVRHVTRHFRRLSWAAIRSMSADFAQSLDISLRVGYGSRSDTGREGRGSEARDIH